MSETKTILSKIEHLQTEMAGIAIYLHRFCIGADLITMDGVERCRESLVQLKQLRYVATTYEKDFIVRSAGNDLMDGVEELFAKVGNTYDQAVKDYWTIESWLPYPSCK